MGQALYRKYRSRALDEIVGQSHITSMLKTAISNGHIAHAYLLTGPRGVGKTSIARILAHEINELPYSDESTHLDIIEIDAASNNSVEDIRDLREKVMIAPSSARKKVYIIDEVHMLSKSAFNALLKTLEEPPEHVVFILATTDIEKLPATIISRVQRFNFKLISPQDAVPHLRMIADTEKISIDDAALELVALHGRGSFRDSISLLDQLRGLGNNTITAELVEQTVGLASDALVQQLLAAHESHDIAALATCIDDAEHRGVSAVLLAGQLIQAIRRDITTAPHRLPLLTALLDVTKSAWPHIKLLTALATPAMAAGAAQPPVTPVAPPVATPAPAKKPAAKPAATPKPAPAEPPHTVATEVAEPTPEYTAAPKLGPDQPFPWQTFIEHVKESSTGAYMILAKSGFAFDGTELLIYAGKPFAKKQLDKSIPIMGQAMQAVGVPDGNITTLETAKPSDNSAIAAALDIMGGGEEVTL